MFIMIFEGRRKKKDQMEKASHFTNKLQRENIEAIGVTQIKQRINFRITAERFCRVIFHTLVY